VGRNPVHALCFDRGYNDGIGTGRGVEDCLPPQSDNKYYLQGYLFGRFRKGFKVTITGGK
jgi:hypothetical protein